MKPVAVELVSRGRIVITAAFIGLGLLMLGFVYYASLDNPQLEQIQVDLVDVKILDTNSIDRRANLEVVFLVTNPSKKTLTVSNINYELFANGNNIGNGEYSTEDIAMTGRAAFYPGQSIELTSIFNLVYTDQIADTYSSIVNGEHVAYKTTGQVSVESAWSIVEKQFESTLN